MRPATSTSTSTHAYLYNKNPTNMHNKFNTSTRLRERLPSGGLPVVEEGSIESLEGGTTLYPRTKDTLAGLFTTVASKSENNSPGSSLSASGHPDHNKSSPLMSHLSEPLNSQNNAQRKGLLARLQRPSLESATYSKLNPATTEFTPTGTPTQASFDSSIQMLNGHGLNGAAMNASLNMAQDTMLPHGSLNGRGNFASQNGGHQSGGLTNVSDGFLSQPPSPTRDLSKFNNGYNLARFDGAGIWQPESNGVGLMYTPENVNGTPQQPINGANGVTGGGNMHLQQLQQPLDGAMKAMPTASTPMKRITEEQAMSLLEDQLSQLNLSQYPQAQIYQPAVNIDRGFGDNSVLNQGGLSGRRPVYDQGFQHVRQQNQMQHNGMQTPMRDMTSPTSFVPSSYRQSPHGSVGSSHIGTPAGSLSGAGRMVYRTEPRSFAPRTNGSATNGAPPRFGLHNTAGLSMPMPDGMSISSQRTNVLSPPPQHGNGIGFSPEGHQQSYGHGIPLTRSAPFSQGELGSTFQPLEPASTALVLHSNTVPEYIRNQRSKQLNELTAGPNQRPTAEVALHADNFPFVEGARNAQPTPHHGVVKLKNIPFATRRTEILAFLGRNSKILNDNQEPVHIIMERVTSKTNDAYVEFMSLQAAVNAVEKHHRCQANGRLSRLGDRPVELELSSQAALMQDLFPLAKGVRWDGPTPVILADHPTQPWNCFKGFITEEEMTMLIKHVEIPQRSPFSKDCPQRPFECMISTLRKFPWYMTECITIKQRNSVYAACVALLRHLQYAIREKKDEVALNQQLYRRLWTSAMLCHGFTVTMKDNIAYMVDLAEDRLREFNMPRFSNLWVHTYTFVPKPGTPLDVIEWYIAMIREETHRTVAQSLPNVQAEIQREGKSTSLYWGYYMKETALPYGEMFDNMTLAEMAAREFGAVAAILQRALPQ